MDALEGREDLALGTQVSLIHTGKGQQFAMCVGDDIGDEPALASYEYAGADARTSFIGSRDLHVTAPARAQNLPVAKCASVIC